MSLQIEVISVFAADGSITPLRFRMEDEVHQLQTVAISQVVCAKPIQYAGIEAIQYLCKAFQNLNDNIFDLSFTVRKHRWTLFRVVY